jgi:hypothetical protein
MSRCKKCVSRETTPFAWRGAIDIERTSSKIRGEVSNNIATAHDTRASVIPFTNTDEPIPASNINDLSGKTAPDEVCR